jgi:hypothetical protein
MRRFRTLRLRRSARTVGAIILGQSAMRELDTTPAPLTLRHATNSIEAELRLIDPALATPPSAQGLHLACGDVSSEFGCS